MGPSPTYHLPEGEECETLVEHELPFWADPAVRCCSRLRVPPPPAGAALSGHLK